MHDMDFERCKLGLDAGSIHAQERCAYCGFWHVTRERVCCQAARDVSRLTDALQACHDVMWSIHCNDIGRNVENTDTARLDRILEILLKPMNEAGRLLRVQ
jgi:hypothetical protein